MGYHGEVNVAQEELNSFLAVAEELRVKGLTQNQSGSSSSSKKEQSSYSVPPSKPSPRLPEASAPPPPAPKRPRPSPITTPNHHNIHTEDDDIQEVVPVKSEPRDPSTMMTHAPTPHAAPAPQDMYSHALQPTEDPELAAYGAEGDQYEDYGQYEGEAYDGAEAGDGNKVMISGMENLEAFLASNIQELSPGVLKCALCDYSYNRRNNVARHIEANHVNTSFHCDLCDKVTPTRH